MVFFAGNALQCHSHYLLARLRARIAARKEDGLQTTEDGYALPEGGAFDLVSCPHYLGEIVLYAGLALMLCKSNISIMVVFAWVVRSCQIAHPWSTAAKVLKAGVSLAHMTLNTCLADFALGSLPRMRTLHVSPTCGGRLRRECGHDACMRWQREMHRRLNSVFAAGSEPVAGSWPNP